MDDVDYQSWAISLATLLDAVEIAAGGGQARETIMGQPARTLIQRLRDNSHGDEGDLSLLSDDAEVAADVLDEVRKLCRSRFDIAEEHGMTVEFGGPTSSVSH